MSNLSLAMLVWTHPRWRVVTHYAIFSVYMPIYLHWTIINKHWFNKSSNQLMFSWVNCNIRWSVADLTKGGLQKNVKMHLKLKENYNSSWHNTSSRMQVLSLLHWKCRLTEEGSGLKKTNECFYVKTESFDFLKHIIALNRAPQEIQ